MFCCRRKWQTSPVFLPGESYRQRSLAGYSPCGHKELDMTEMTRQYVLLFRFKINKASIFFNKVKTKKKKKEFHKQE